MKKYFLCLIVVLMISGCAAPVFESPVAAELEDLPEPVTEWTVTDGITIRLMNKEFPVGVEQMTIIMENRTDQIMLYGNGWSFERYENGRWIPLPNRENVGFTAEGYTLYEHKMDVFHASTFALKKSLAEGLYRVTGCSLRVADDEENLSANGDHSSYPAYQLEFIVSRNALPDRGYPEESAEPGKLLPKEDWEWYTPWEALRLFEDSGESVWRFVEDEGSLVALLHRPDTPENEYLNAGDLLSLHLFDRATGEIFAVFDELTVESDNVSSAEGGGFDIETAEGRYYAGRTDGEWVKHQAAL